MNDLLCYVPVRYNRFQAFSIISGEKFIPDYGIFPGEFPGKLFDFFSCRIIVIIMKDKFHNVKDK